MAEPSISDLALRTLVSHSGMKQDYLEQIFGALNLAGGCYLVVGRPGDLQDIEKLQTLARHTDQ